MGLDMYLSAKKYLSPYGNPSVIEQIKKTNEIFQINEDSDYGVSGIIFNVAYWRKANMIHDWFVKNCQDGKDDCEEYSVTSVQLQQLVNICKEVLAEPPKAESLLPSAPGFFFGSTDYDDLYFSHLRYTVERISKILADPALGAVDFYYQSSW